MRKIGRDRFACGTPQIPLSKPELRRLCLSRRWPFFDHYNVIVHVNAGCQLSIIKNPAIEGVENNAAIISIFEPYVKPWASNHMIQTTAGMGNFNALRLQSFLYLGEDFNVFRF